MTNIELIGWITVILGVIINTVLNFAKKDRDRQNQQIIIDELEALRKELNEKN